MLVLLVALLVGDEHALTGELAPAQLTDAGDDVGQRLVGRHGEELGAVVVGAVGVPRLGHRGEVVDEQLGDDASGTSPRRSALGAVV